MATGGEDPVSLSAGSEEVVDPNCTICLKYNKTVEGTYFCIDCKVNYCSSCSDMHAKFPANVGHRVIAIGNAQGQALHVKARSDEGHGSILTARGGSSGQGDVLGTNCRRFEVLCSLSDPNKAEQQRTMASTLYSPAVQSLRGPSDVDKWKAVHSKLTSVKENLDSVKSAKQDQLKSVHSSEKNDLESVDGLRVKLITRINELADEEHCKIKAKYLPEKQAISVDIAEIDDHIGIITNDDKTLKDAIGAYGMRRPVNTDAIEKNVDASFTCYNDLWQSLAKALPKYRLDTSLEAVLQRTHSLGDFNITAELQGEVDIRLAGDTSVCDVNGSCLLADGTIVLVDADNQKLKHVNLDSHEISHCAFDGEPCAVCSISYSEVAVTLTKEKRVQIVSLTGSSPTKKRSFPVEQCCRGIFHHNGELFISCANNGESKSAFVAVYTLSGTLLRKIETYDNNQRIFSSPFHITVDVTGNIHVADSEKGVISIDRFGRDASVYTDRCLKSAFGIFQMNDHSLLVGGLESHNIVHLRGSSSARTMTPLLDKASDIYWPLSVLYDCSRSLLIVTLQRSDSVKIYKLN